jgi:hypothetical protein
VQALARARAAEDQCHSWGRLPHGSL